MEDNRRKGEKVNLDRTFGVTYNRDTKEINSL